MIISNPKEILDKTKGHLLIKIESDFLYNVVKYEEVLRTELYLNRYEGGGVNRFYKLKHIDLENNKFSGQLIDIYPNEGTLNRGVVQIHPYQGYINEDRLFVIPEEHEDAPVDYLLNYFEDIDLEELEDLGYYKDDDDNTYTKDTYVLAHVLLKNIPGIFNRIQTARDFLKVYDRKYTSLASASSFQVRNTYGTWQSAR